eukprot:11426998-Ditylum_brightwellii.AAC.1
MARSRRRAIVRGHSKQVKKSRASDHMSDDGAMDLDHSGVDENVMEKLEKSDAGFTHDDVDSSDDAGKKGKKDDEDDADSNNSSNDDNYDYVDA